MCLAVSCCPWYWIVNCTHTSNANISKLSRDSPVHLYWSFRLILTNRSPLVHFRLRPAVCCAPENPDSSDFDRIVATFSRFTRRHRSHIQHDIPDWQTNQESKSRKEVRTPPTTNASLLAQLMSVRMWLQFNHLTEPTTAPKEKKSNQISTWDTPFYIFLHFPISKSPTNGYFSSVLLAVLFVPIFAHK